MQSTHKVIDQIYSGQDDEIDEYAFVGTQSQCQEFVNTNGGMAFEIVPLSLSELNELDDPDNVIIN